MPWLARGRCCFLLCSHIDQAAGIGADVGTNGSANLDDVIIRDCDTGLGQLFGQGFGHGAVIGVHHIEGEGGVQ